MKTITGNWQPIVGWAVCVISLASCQQERGAREGKPSESPDSLFGATGNQPVPPSSLVKRSCYSLVRQINHFTEQYSGATIFKTYDQCVGGTPYPANYCLRLLDVTGDGAVNSADRELIAPLNGWATQSNVAALEAICSTLK